MTREIILSIDRYCETALVRWLLSFRSCSYYCLHQPCWCIGLIILAAWNRYLASLFPPCSPKGQFGFALFKFIATANRCKDQSIAAFHSHSCRQYRFHGYVFGRCCADSFQCFIPKSSWCLSSEIVSKNVHVWIYNLKLCRACRIVW